MTSLVICLVVWSLFILAGLGQIRFIEVAKDGGPKSRVSGFWVIEVKRLFSIAILVFHDGTREAFHNHAFHSISWLIRGHLVEEHLKGTMNEYRPSWRPIVTLRRTFHKVRSFGTSIVLTFRGPWCDYWYEFDEETSVYQELTHGRQIVWASKGRP